MKGIDIRPNIFWSEISGGSALGDVDDYIGIHLQDSNSADLVNYVGLQIDAESAASGNIFGIYQLGVGMENRLVSNLNIFGEDATPAATVDAVQDSTTGAQPVMRLKQDDVDEDYFKFVGTSDTSADRALVDAADFSTIGALKGFLKINIQDDQATNPIVDGDFFIPFYAVPTA